jgi:hypothetical protein
MAAMTRSRSAIFAPLTRTVPGGAASEANSLPPGGAGAVASGSGVIDLARTGVLGTAGMIISSDVLFHSMAERHWPWQQAKSFLTIAGPADSVAVR